jgi:transcription elongation factor Elf1
MKLRIKKNLFSDKREKKLQFECPMCGDWVRVEYQDDILKMECYCGFNCEFNL